MRVIAGRLRSRTLKSVPGLETRPTPDRLREALFNVLAPQIEGVEFLDAYAGTGAVGIEALSRGARYAVFLERNSTALRILRENLQALDLTTQSAVVRGAVLANIAGQRCDICFLDPPFEKTAEYEGCLSRLADTKCRLAIAQHASRHVLADAYGVLKRTRVLRQGDNSLSFYIRE